MGERGPAPKRSDQRRRRNQSEGPQELTKAPAGDAPEVPVADPEWHPSAVRWYASLEASGQSRFYEASDWSAAWLLAESMSRELKPQPVVDKDGNVSWVSFPPKAASLAAWLKGMSVLLATEGDRRRAAMELQRPASGDEGGADVSWLDDARNRLGGAG